VRALHFCAPRYLKNSSSQCQTRTETLPSTNWILLPLHVFSVTCVLSQNATTASSSGRLVRLIKLRRPGGRVGRVGGGEGQSHFIDSSTQSVRHRSLKRLPRMSDASCASSATQAFGRARASVRCGCGCEGKIMWHAGVLPLQETCFSEISRHTPLLPADGAAHSCLKSHDKSIEVEHCAEWQALQYFVDVDSS